MKEEKSEVASLDDASSDKAIAKQPWIMPTVRKLDPEKDRALIEAFKEKTGIP